MNLGADRLISRVGAAAGFVLWAVAWTHIILIWTPPKFGVPPWEFAAATQALDVLPLAVTGIALLAMSVVFTRKRAGMAVVATVAIVTSLVIAALVIIFTLDLLVAWNSVTATLRENLIKTAIKSLIFGVMFFGFHVWLAVQLLRMRKR